MGLEAKQNGVQQAARPEREKGCSPGGPNRVQTEVKEGFSQRTLSRQIDAVCSADRQLDRASIKSTENVERL